MTKLFSQFDPPQYPVADTDVIVGYQTINGVKTEVRYARSDVSGFHTFATYALAAAAIIPQPGFVFVQADESIDGGPSTYFWNGSTLEYVVMN
jgi:hypothetical protein